MVFRVFTHVNRISRRHCGGCASAEISDNVAQVQRCFEAESQMSYWQLCMGIKEMKSNQCGSRFRRNNIMTPVEVLNNDALGVGGDRRTESALRLENSGGMVQSLTPQTAGMLNTVNLMIPL